MGVLLTYLIEFAVYLIAIALAYVPMANGPQVETGLIAANVLPVIVTLIIVFIIPFHAFMPFFIMDTGMWRWMR